MGIATISILLCHTPANIPSLPSIVSLIFNQFQYGVDIFFLLSGLGLFYSLNKHSEGLLSWYRHRFSRLLLPYILISLPFWLINPKHSGIVECISFLSGFSFWTRHDGAWFIIALMPCYLLSPFLFILFKKTNNHFGIALVLTLLCILICMPQSEDNGVLHNIQFVGQRVPSFILGMWLGPYVAKQKTIQPYFIIVLLLIMAVLMQLFLPKSISKGIFVSFPLIWMCTLIVPLTHDLFKKILVFFGDISLESYLFNVNLPVFFLRVPFLCNQPDYSRYIIALLLGTMLSYIVHMLVKQLNSGVRKVLK